jgi:hypothetical protein
MNLQQLNDRVTALEIELPRQFEARLKANERLVNWLKSNPGKTREDYHAEVANFREWLKTNPKKVYKDFLEAKAAAAVAQPEAVQSSAELDLEQSSSDKKDDADVELL